MRTPDRDPVDVGGMRARLAAAWRRARRRQRLAEPCPYDDMLVHFPEQHALIMAQLAHAVDQLGPHTR